MSLRRHFRHKVTYLDGRRCSHRRVSIGNYDEMHGSAEVRLVFFPDYAVYVICITVNDAYDFVGHVVHIIVIDDIE